MRILTSIAFILALISIPQLAIEYFADGCMVIDHKGKIIKVSENEYRFEPTIQCTKIFLK